LRGPAARPAPAGAPTPEQLAQLQAILGRLHDGTYVLVGGNLLPFFKNSRDFGAIKRVCSPNGELEAVLFPVDAGAKAIQQPRRGGGGAFCSSLDEVYAAAEVAGPQFMLFVDGLAELGGPGVRAKHPPGLKDRERAGKKAHDKYGGNPALLFDLARGTVVCSTTAEAIAVLDAVRADPRLVAVVKWKNRFENPTANGFSDFLLQLLLRFEDEEGNAVQHICELQVHMHDIITYKEASGYYKYLREFFQGSDMAVRARLADLDSVVGDRFFDEVADHGADSPAELTKKLVADVFASGDVRRLWVLAGLFADYVQEPDLALLLYGQQLALTVAAEGPGDAAVGVCYNSMANVLKDQGELGRATELYEKALAILIAVKGPDHGSVAGSYNNIANVLADQGEHGRAMGLYEKALAIKVKALGPDHSGVAMAYNNMGEVLKAQGELPRALVLYEKAQAIYTKALGPDHSSVGITQFNMAELAEKGGDTARARELYTEAHRIWTAAYGPEHGETLDAAQQLARLDA